jgi:hypothetical protein
MPDIADSERGLPPTRARTNNPGDRVGTESRNGVLYARYRARPNTWVSASMKELGYDRVYGPDSAYGARTGMVLGADGKPLKDPDRIQPGQEYLIPIGAAAQPAPEKPRRAPVTSGARPRTEVPYRRPREVAEGPPLSRATPPQSRALDNPMVSRRVTTDADEGGEARQFTSAGTTVKCYSPYPLRGSEYADILGIVAHAFIQKDYVDTKKLRRNRNVHIDDTFYYKPFNNFLINKNLRNLTPAQKAAIKAYRGPRPDIVLDTGAERGFEEIKPDNLRGIARGEGQVREVRDFFAANNLPYPFSTDYEPKAEITVGMFWVLTEPIDVYLACKRKRGLIVYHYCFRADWKRLKGKTQLLFALFIAFIWLILKMKDGVPAPGPGPVPLPPLPPGNPILDPIMPPPETVPAQPSVRAYVPASTLEALKPIHTSAIATLAEQDLDIEFEPYVER